MIKILSLSFALLSSILIHAQDPDIEYRYEFSMTGITDYGPAKMQMENIRDLMGIQVIKFIDTSNRFIVLTHLEFDPAELLMKLESNGIDVDGEIYKIIIG
jgi:hypothetical protein